MKDKPIGIFDSGVGGLTVVKAVRKALKAENIIYFGDTARVPYGTKSREAIMRFAQEDVGFLLSKDVKVIIAACNTVSAIALDKISGSYSVPIIGVLEPGAKAACRKTSNSRVGVIGTSATISSGAYTEHIRKNDSAVKVFTQACPLFVPIVEEGWENTELALIAARQYLSPLSANDIDTLVLGCTHYPLLKNTIKEAVGPHVSLVDSADEVSSLLKATLESNEILSEQKSEGWEKFFLSDIPPNFIGLAERFLGEQIKHVERAYL
ncbi:glutamate racemase [candidate division WOR-3 bacterium]|nr:glutamate racemase [candidate division WOR-3 bacterium]